MDEQATWKVHPDGTAWIVEQHEEPGVSSRHKDQRAAVREARSLARASPPSHVVVHDEDGDVVWSMVYSDTGGSGGPAEALTRQDGKLPIPTDQALDPPDPTVP